MEATAEWEIVGGVWEEGRQVTRVACAQMSVRLLLICPSRVESTLLESLGMF